MGRKMIGLWAAVGVVAAVLAVTVPLIARIREKQVREQSVEDIRECMETMDPETVMLHQSLARWYNLNVALDEPEPGLQDAYGGILNLGQGRMGLLEIPELELTLPITHGTQGAAGHDPASALPVGGQGDHTVLYLKDGLPLAEGMEVHTILPGVSICYRVDSVQVMPGLWPTDCPSPGEMLILVHDRGNRRTIARCVIEAGQKKVPEDQWRILKIAVLFAASVTLLAAVTRILDGQRKRLRRNKKSVQPEFLE